MSESLSKEQQQADLADLLSSMLNNPDSMPKISEIIERHTSNQNRDNPPQQDDILINSADSTTILGDIPSTIKEDSPTEQNNKNQDAHENPLGFLSLFSREKLGSLALKNEQITLLSAIRPYLSDHRKEVVDNFIRLGKLAQIFNNLS